MPCCWAGDNGEFNNMERARAWVVYSTVIVLSPISLYVVHNFYVTRDNYEMKIREPGAVILCSFTMWVSLILESLYHLLLNLDVAEDNWRRFNVIRPSSAAEICDMFAYAGFVLAGSMYLFRVWMFWYKSGVNEEAHGYGEVVAAQTMRGRPQLKSFYTNRRKDLGNRKVVTVACLLWFAMAIAPIVVVDFILNVDRRLLKHIICAAVLIPVPCVMFYLLRNRKNKFGIVTEYKIAFLILLFTNGLNILLYFTGMKNSYYRWLIDYWLRSVLICAYFFWLMRFIRTFSIDNINNKEDRDCWSDFKKILCCDRTWVLGLQAKTISFDAYQLNEVLEHKAGYNLFRDHVRDTLCAENLLFFRDVYLHRKNLGEDPYIKLSVNDSDVIKACARVEMKWVDQESKRTPGMIPTSTDIYKLYIRPFSQMEVNIPGRMRKSIVREFERKKLNFRKRLSIAVGLSSPPAPCRQFERSAVVLPEVELTPKANSELRESRTIEANLETREIRATSQCSKAGRGNSVNRTNPQSSTYSTASEEVLEIRGDPIVSGSDVIPPHFHFTSIKNCGQSEPSIEYLYPAWKTLVNLLKNDSLVRFKMGNR